MFNKKECVAMLLAGGQGSRLYALTNKIAKPAVPFGAKYRIIDFPLSNCINSNIDTVGVLTQYEPLLLNRYIGNGQPWDLDRNFGGVHILPPYQAKKKNDWYKGTANAIYQNMDFIKRYHPEVVLILSGDHIYKMDYSAMIRFHQEKKADITIAVLEVPMEEAHRFGIMNTDDDFKIIDFEEKPTNPKSNQASMGIYVFSTEVLYRYLIADEEDSKSQNDFGKNIIPNMLADHARLYAYPFKGYWKDVGTISSLLEANMDLLGDHPAFDLSELNWKIYSRNDAYPPQLITETAHIEDSLITDGCLIEGTVIHSILSNNVRVRKGAVIKDSVIFQDSVIEKDVTIHRSIIDEEVRIEQGAIIGQEGSPNISVIASNVHVSANQTIAAGTIQEENC